eukprot:g2709.t1
MFGGTSLMAHSDDVYLIDLQTNELIALTQRVKDFQSQEVRKEEELVRGDEIAEQQTGNEEKQEERENQRTYSENRFPIDSHDAQCSTEPTTFEQKDILYRWKTFCILEKLLQKPKKSNSSIDDRVTNKEEKEVLNDNKATKKSGKIASTYKEMLADVQRLPKTKRAAWKLFHSKPLSQAFKLLCRKGDLMLLRFLWTRHFPSETQNDHVMSREILKRIEVMLTTFPTMRMEPSTGSSSFGSADVEIMFRKWILSIVIPQALKYFIHASPKNYRNPQGTNFSDDVKKKDKTQEVEKKKAFRKDLAVIDGMFALLIDTVIHRARDIVLSKDDHPTRVQEGLAWLQGFASLLANGNEARTSLTTTTAADSIGHNDNNRLRENRLRTEQGVFRETMAIDIQLHQTLFQGKLTERAESRLYLAQCTLLDYVSLKKLSPNFSLRALELVIKNEFQSQTNPENNTGLAKRLSDRNGPQGAWYLAFKH